MAFSISSPAFAAGDSIPDRFSKDGGNASPPLQWSDVPEGTRSFALLVEDPDAPSGTFRHWAVYDIPADRQGLDEGVDVSAFGRGRNDFGNDGYDGPRPPSGHGAHRYYFRVAALDTDRLSDVADGSSAAAVWDEALRHVIEEAELVGTYARG
jgi:Raf kinase inhibitor-like YbhB/YbcL family protein